MHGVRQILIHPDYKPSNSSHPGNNDIGMAMFIFLLLISCYQEFYPSQFPFGSSCNALKITSGQKLGWAPL